MSGACGMSGRQKCMQGFGRETGGKETMRKI